MDPTTKLDTTTATFPTLRPLLEYLDRLGQPADLETLRRLLTELGITRADLNSACIFKKDRYQRNLIRQTDWYELLCLCWMSGQRTPIHDHKGSACAFLVVDGIATETRFDRTASGLISSTWTKHHEPGYVCVSSEADVHQVANIGPPGTELVTLHCYTPRLKSFNTYEMGSELE